MNIEEALNQFDTKEELIADIDGHLQDLAKENPDYNYSGCDPEVMSSYHIKCRYNSGPYDDETQEFVEGKESKGCIFGQTLQRMGWDGKFSDDMSGELGIEYDGIASILNSMSVLDYVDTCRYSEIQSEQDKGVVWGKLILG